MVTVLEVLRGASDYLDKKQVESARLNAEHLLAHVMKKKRIELYMEFDRPLGEEVRAPMRELIRARGEGRPLQHLLGSVEFLGREFLCDARALIPRPETEQLVEMVLKQVSAGPILDVGTGSGVIAISLALERPDSPVTAVDLHDDPLALAAENANKLSAPVTFRKADLLPEDISPQAVIVANLPYIPAGEIAGLSREVQMDPVSALDGGADGMDLLRRLISSAPKALQPGGLIALEIGSGQDADVTAFLKSNNFRDIEAHPDYQGHIRFLFATYG